MTQMLQAPIEGYEDAIVVPQINANNFELKQTLINLVQSNQFTGRQDPHNHLRFFNKVTSTFRYPEILACYDDDDDDDYTIAITHKEPDNSLSMRDEHLDTILATKSNEFIKSSVENLVPNLSESKGKYECDVSACEVFTTFSNILFDSDYDFSSVDDQSFSDEDIPKEIYSNPLFDEEIITIKINPHHFNAESDLIESLLNRDSLIISSSSKIDSLFDEFSGELTLLKSIPPGITETDCNPEEETHFIKRLLYDNSSPHSSEEFIFENHDAAFESFSPFLFPVEDSDSLMEEIDLSLLWMTHCHRELRKMTMTLKGIFSSLKNCLTMIPFHFLKMSHFILISFILSSSCKTTGW
nr:reverse transcriptase domain-containing protein [Tanacetum cinerariifolium]